MNAADADGNITRCRICDSKYHWQYNCPVNESQRSKMKANNDAQNISLFQSQQQSEDEMRIFVGETFNCAVLDSGCKLYVVLSGLSAIKSVFKTIQRL